MLEGKPNQVEQFGFLQVGKMLSCTAPVFIHSTTASITCCVLFPSLPTGSVGALCRRACCPQRG
jgi:hypothetical protein